MRLSDLQWDRAKVVSDAEFECFGMLNSDAPGAILSFYANPGFKAHLENVKLKCVICKEEQVCNIPPHISGIVIADNPMYEFWKMHNLFGMDKSNKDTIIGEDCNISSHAVIAKKNVVIGNHVTIEEFVSIKSGTVIGDNTVIQAGTVIGCEGLQLAVSAGNKVRARHYGGVYIGNNVVFESNGTVLKGVFEWEKTQICDECWIAGNSYISHGDNIGKGVFVGAMTSIMGGSNIGMEAVINAGAHIHNQVSIGEKSIVSIGSVVRKSIGPNLAYVEGRSYSRRLYEAAKSM